MVSTPESKRMCVGIQDETIVVNDRNKAQAIQALLDQGHSEAFWQALTKSDPDLANPFGNRSAAI